MTQRLLRFLATCTLGTFALVIPSRAHADIVFSNFGIGNTFNSGAANPVGFDFFTGDVDAQAGSFLPSATATLTRLAIALSAFQGTNGAPVTVSLVANSGGLPGAVFETWIIPVGALGTFGSAGVPVFLNSILHPTLGLGTRYWVTASTGSAESIAWNLTVLGDPNPTATSVNGGAAWNTLGLTPGAMQLEGVLAPEPTSFVLYGTGLVAVGGFVRRRRSKRMM